jgi:hypothetical protein
MKRRLAPLSFTALVVLFSLPVPSWPQSPRPSGMTEQQSSSRPKGFFDYALSRVNPQHNDYGAAMQSARDDAIAVTVDDLYFWSNVVTLCVFTGVTTLFLLHLRGVEKKEIIAARLITELWNGRVSDRLEIKHRTEQYNRLVEQKNAETTQRLAAASGGRTSELRTDARTQKKVERLLEGRKPGPVEDPALQPGTEIRANGGPDVASVGVTELQQQNLLLQRTVEATRNSEHNLRERLNQTTSLFEQERKRNQALKGA